VDHLAHDLDVARLEHERVEGGAHRALEGILDRHERLLDLSFLDRDHAVVNRGKWHWLDLRPVDRGKQGLFAESAFGP
jgi:hypothetical protein